MGSLWWEEGGQGKDHESPPEGDTKGKAGKELQQTSLQVPALPLLPVPSLGELPPPLTLTTPVARQDSLTHLSSHTRGLQIAPTHLPTPRSVTLPKAPFLQRHLPAPLSLTGNLRIHLHSPLPSLYFPLCPGLIISSFKTYAATFGEYKRS